MATKIDFETDGGLLVFSGAEEINRILPDSGSLSGKAIEKLLVKNLNLAKCIPLATPEGRFTIEVVGARDFARREEKAPFTVVFEVNLHCPENLFVFGLMDIYSRIDGGYDLPDRGNPFAKNAGEPLLVPEGFHRVSILREYEWKRGDQFPGRGGKRRYSLLFSEPNGDTNQFSHLVDASRTVLY